MTNLNPARTATTLAARMAGACAFALSALLLVSCTQQKVDSGDPGERWLTQPSQWDVGALDTVPVRVEFDPETTTLGGTSYGTVEMKNTTDRPVVVVLTATPRTALSYIPPTVTVSPRQKLAYFKVIVASQTPAKQVDVVASTSKTASGTLKIR
jgi:hypothetical protein